MRSAFIWMPSAEADGDVSQAFVRSGLLPTHPLAVSDHRGVRAAGRRPVTECRESSGRAHKSSPGRNQAATQCAEGGRKIGQSVSELESCALRLQGSTRDFFLGPTLGCLELASDINTALAFALLRREEFLGSTGEPAMGLDMRVFARRITGSFHDLTKLDPNLPKAERRKIGHQLRDSGSPGVLFCRPGFGEHRFLSVFDGALLPRAVQGAHYRFVWDGQKIKNIYDFSDGKEILRGALLVPDVGRDAAE
jgi:hypothetical protein